MSSFVIDIDILRAKEWSKVDITVLLVQTLRNTIRDQHKSMTLNILPKNHFFKERSIFTEYSDLMAYHHDYPLIEWYSTRIFTLKMLFIIIRNVKKIKKIVLFAHKGFSRPIPCKWYYNIPLDRQTQEITKPRQTYNRYNKL